MRSALLAALTIASPVAVGLAFAAPAAAQMGGTRINPVAPAMRAGGPMNAATEARVVMLRFGQCVLARRPAQAERYMRAPLNERGFNRAAYDLSADDCLGQGQLTLNASLLRGSLWAAAYRRDHARRQPAYAPVDWAAGLPAGPETDSFVSTRAYASCILNAQPAAAHAALTAPPASPEEDAAFASLAPALSSCLAAGSTLRLNKMSLQMLLAEAAYRAAG